MIHESLFYAMWGTFIACVVGFTADVPSVLQAALIVIAVSLFVTWIFLPPVPEYRPRRRSSAKKRTPKRRKQKHWSF